MTGLLYRLVTSVTDDFFLELGVGSWELEVALSYAYSFQKKLGAQK